MGKYIARRILWLPVIMFATSVMVFSLFRLVPGDPVTVMLGARYTEERAERLRETFGLNRHITVQYVDYMAGVFRGDFGESFRYRGRDVNELLWAKIKVSAQLNIAALTIVIGIGLPLGFYIAHKQGSWQDPVAVATAVMIMSIPIMVTAPFMLWAFCLKLHWVPCSGWGGLFDSRIVIPAIVMGVPGIAGMARLMRASTLDVMHQDFIRTAHAKGLDQTTIDRRHVFKNAMIPIVTVLSFTFAGLLGGSVIAERIMGIPGVGRLVIDSLFERDYPVVMAVSMLGTFVFVLAILAADIAYAYVDPRIRYR